MNVERRILAWLNRGPDDLDLFEAALAPRELPDAGPASWLTDRLRFLYTCTFTMAKRARVPAGRPATTSVIYDAGIGWDPKALAYRQAFTEHHFGERPDPILGSKGIGGAAAASPPSAAEQAAARVWRRRAITASMVALLDFSSRRYYWWGGVFLDVYAFARISDSVRRAYVFRLYDRRSYCVGSYLRRYVTEDVLFVYQGMPLWFNQRNLHAPVKAVLTSKVNTAEVDHFRQAGHFKAAEILYRPQEFLLDRQGIEPSEPIYDLGFFASGDWARRGGGRYWSSDIEAIKRGDYRNNVFDQHSSEVLSALAGYAHRNSRTLRIYMHPYERNLLAEHGIEPPYRGLADDLISIDDKPGTSRGAVYEPYAAVAVRSSTIWERIDLGLEESYIYSFGDDLDIFLPDSLGEYRRNTFASEAELAEKLDAAFSAREQRSDATLSSEEAQAQP